MVLKAVFENLGEFPCTGSCIDEVQCSSFDGGFDDVPEKLSNDDKLGERIDCVLSSLGS